MHRGYAGATVSTTQAELSCDAGTTADLRTVAEAKKAALAETRAWELVLETEVYGHAVSSYEEVELPVRGSGEDPSELRALERFIASAEEERQAALVRIDDLGQRLLLRRRGRGPRSLP